jgi:hypothetical protein
MFHFFFQLHAGGYNTQTIITDQQKTIESAIQELQKDQIFMGVHIFDPFHMVNNVRENLRGDEENARKALSAVSRAIQCRSLKEYQRCQNEMNRDTDNIQVYG